MTAAQAFQWMAPSSTFAEVRRLLRPGGVFAAYQYASLSVEPGDGERVVAFALSEGSLQTLLPHVTEAEIGLDRLRAAAAALPSGP